MTTPNQTQMTTWRTKLEISLERQKELDTLRAEADPLNGKYPFAGVKLDRADIEWLLVTHENGRGPVDWNDPEQHQRKGLDLRGADLSGIDLSRLPLAGMIGGLTLKAWREAPFREREALAVNLNEAYMLETHLEGAILRSAHLERAYLRNAHLEEAYMRYAHFEGASLRYVHLERADIGEAFFDAASQVLDGFAGYGYKPYRFFFAAFIILVIFWAIYSFLALITGEHLTILNALGLSLQNLFVPNLTPFGRSPQETAGAIEGLFGLFIAAIVIAIVTNQILNK